MIDFRKRPLLLFRLRLPLGRPVIRVDIRGVVLAQGEYLDNLLAMLPDVYKALGRQGIYGDYFAYYACEIILKLNGKGGQPVYVQLTKQTTGRCTPK